MRPLYVPSNSDHDVEAMLRRIGRRVLDDIWISRRLRVFTGAVSAALAGAAVFGWADVRDRSVTATPGIAICAVALTFFSITTALCRLRCCAAAFAGAPLPPTAVGWGWSSAWVWCGGTKPHRTPSAQDHVPGWW
jgi:hypothetical protein